MLGVVLIELNTGWDVVSEDGSYERYPDTDFEVIGETNLLRIPSPPATEITLRIPMKVARDSDSKLPLIPVKVATP